MYMLTLLPKGAHEKNQKSKILWNCPFKLLVFFMNQFPQASEYTITAISNFFENSRRYSRLKVHHRCHNLVWAPLGSRVNIYINFCLQVHFKVSAAWYCSHCLPPVSLSTTPVANLPPVSLIPVAIFHRRQICRRYRWHRWQICHRCQQQKGNWLQNLPPVLMGYSGAGGKLILKTNQKQKISWHCPFKVTVLFYRTRF